MNWLTIIMAAMKLMNAIEMLINVNIIVLTVLVVTFVLVKLGIIWKAMDTTALISMNVRLVMVTAIRHV
jgi:hypothetical protein